jgi:hypothetical protein
VRYGATEFGGEEEKEGEKEEEREEEREGRKQRASIWHGTPFRIKSTYPYPMICFL